MLTNGCEKDAFKFGCEKCDYYTSKKSSYDKHLLSAKHSKLTQLTQKNDVIKKDFVCEMCNKIYKSRVGLWMHSKKCLQKESKSIVLENDSVKELIKLNKSILLENQEFKKLIMELVSKPTITNNNSNVNSNNTISHNKQFNLQFFLNETCKNAMNINEFMDSLEIKSDELEDMGNLGYVKGISNIFIRALNELDETERPIHCTDKKREIMYVKDNNVWEKETVDKFKIKKIVTYIANKNFRRIPKWRADNPQSDDIMSKKHMEYMNMLHEIMTGITPDDDTGVNKIIRTVANEVYLDKSGGGSVL